MNVGTPLPSGLVTFAFIDVVGSTKTFIAHGDVYVDAVTAMHGRAVAHAERHGGVVVETEGDGAFLAFPTAAAAVGALLALQEELENPVGDGLHLRIRSGAHTGDAVPVAGKYLALAVYVAARLSATANAGQILVSDSTLEELNSLGDPAAGTAVDVGTYQLKDLSEPTRIWRLRGDETLPRATPARRTNVMAPHTSFLGRDGDLRRLRDLVDRPGLVTVVGPGGTGKTRLVSEFALAESDTFDAGVWLVELATQDDPGQILPSIGATLGLVGAEAVKISEELNRRGRCVLVIDNCEHLLDAVVDVVDGLVAAHPRLTVLCTSREQLSLAGERVLALEPLVIHESATDLYLDRAADAAGGEADRALVAELCAALDGLPLAIELVASQARYLPLPEILAAVTRGDGDVARRGGQDRQRSLDAVLEWSLSRQPTAVRNSLLTLAIFPGRFSAEMARVVLEAAPSCAPTATPKLARASLVDLDGSDYRLLSTVRAAALRKLAGDPGLARQAHDALATWAAQFGKERFDVLTYHEDVPADTFLAVQSALHHALDADLPGMGKAWHFMEVVVGARGGSPELIALAERAVAVDASDAEDAWTPICAANLLNVLGREPPGDASRFETFVELARRSGDIRLQLSALGALASMRRHRDDSDGALACLREQVEVAAHPEARHNLSYALGNLGYHLQARGDVEEAEEVLTRTIEAAKDPWSWQAYCVGLLNLADFALGAGRISEAREHVLESLKQAPPDWWLRGCALAVLSLAHLRLDDRPACLAAGRLAIQALRDHPEGLAIDETQKVLEQLPREIYDEVG